MKAQALFLAIALASFAVGEPLQITDDVASKLESSPHKGLELDQDPIKAAMMIPEDNMNLTKPHEDKDVLSVDDEDFGGTETGDVSDIDDDNEETDEENGGLIPSPASRRLLRRRRSRRRSRRRRSRRRRSRRRTRRRSVRRSRRRRAPSRARARRAAARARKARARRAAAKARARRARARRARRLRAKRLRAKKLRNRRLRARRLRAKRLRAKRLRAKRLRARRARARRLRAKRLRAKRLRAKRLRAKRLRARRARARRARRLRAKRLRAKRLRARRLRAKRLRAKRLRAKRLRAKRLRAKRLRAKRLRNRRLRARRARRARHLRAKRLRAKRLRAKRARARRARALRAKKLRARKLRIARLRARRLRIRRSRARRARALRAARLRSSRKPFPIKMTVDNTFRVYVNGKKVGSGNSWTRTYSFRPRFNKVTTIAVEGRDRGGPAALIGVFNGRPTKASEWKCKNFGRRLPRNWMSPTFDDSKWPRARSYGRNNQNTIWRRVGRGRRPGIPNRAEWIWTRDNNNHNRVICRTTLVSKRSLRKITVRKGYANIERYLTGISRDLRTDAKLSGNLDKRTRRRLNRYNSKIIRIERSVRRTRKRLRVARRYNSAYVREFNHMRGKKRSLLASLKRQRKFHGDELPLSLK